MKSVAVTFREPRNRGYEILIQPGLLKGAGAMIKRRFPGHSPFVISSPRIWKLWGSAFKGTLKHLVPDGEKHKDFKEYGKALAALAAFKPEKKPLVLVLGGGVLGDLGGFAAASYQRGIPFVQIPSTLLSMLDSSVGGKLGIDFDTPQGRVKNLVGAFYQPSLVLIDPLLLSTLPARELRAGFAEAVKTATLFDRALFAQMETNAGRLLALDTAPLVHMIHTCVAHKARVVMKDEFDVKGGRALLNLGHTFGHAVETASGFGLLHGEAVAFGLACAVDLSARLGMADPGLMRVEALLQRLGLLTRLPALPMRQVMAALSRDKKFENGMRFVVPQRLGHSVLLPLPKRSLSLVRDIIQKRFDPLD
ncbi:MAG: 3-dehydroquinate synthase family protein [candidate division FCPU426 bacterium]